MTKQFSIEVRGERPDEVTAHKFDRLPIAIGRHASNDLQLDRAFISSFHARVEESGGRLRVVDLGSRNGVQVRTPSGRKQRIATHEPHELGPSGGEFCVGNYSFRLLRGASAPPAAPLAELDLSLDAVSLEAAASEVGASLDESGSLPSLPGRAPAAVPPAVPRSSPPAAAATQRAREARALEELEQLARALVPGQTLETTSDVTELVRRLRAALEASCQGLVRLRRAQRRTLSALRLPAPVSEAEPGWGNVEDAAQLLHLLLDARRATPDAARLLTAEFQALAVHQVALLEGMLEGAGALLGELSPERIEAELPRGAAAFGGKLRASWRAYRGRHAQLSRRDGALSLAFGRAFREAYAAYHQQAPGRSARRGRKLR